MPFCSTKRKMSFEMSDMRRNDFGLLVYVFETNEYCNYYRANVKSENDL